MNIDRGKESFTAEEIESLAAQLRDHKVEAGLSWVALAKKIGHYHNSVIQLFSTGKYTGDVAEVAWQVNRYFLNEEAKRQQALVAPVVPGYRQTRTSRMMTAQLRWAHAGEMVAIVGEPGLGKTATFDQYCGATPNAFKATMEPATRSVQPMLCEILRACGAQGKMSTAALLLQTLTMRLDGLSPLIIVDEAQHLTDQSLDQLRSIHDRLKCGVVLAGNPKVMTRVNGFAREADFAQLSSRVSWPQVYRKPFQEDVDILLDAWDARDPRQREFLTKVAMLPGALRSMTQVLKMATLTAQADDEDRTLSHLKGAWQQIKQRNLKVLGEVE